MTASTIGNKLCWNCDGDIPLQSARCPYCGVQIQAEAKEEMEEPKLPDSVRNREPFALVSPAPRESEAPQPPKRVAVDTERSETLRPLLLILPGIVFLIFGIVLQVFSDGEYFTLRWKASFAWWFLAAAAPLLYYGWRAVDGMRE